MIAGSRSFAVRGAGFSAALFLAAGMYLPFFPIWLDHKGLSPAEMAIILAAPMYLRALISPSLVVAADRLGELRRAAVVYAFLTTAFFVALAGVASFWAILLLSSLSMVFRSALVPISDAVILFGTRTHGTDYARVRLWGSAAFVAGAYGAAEMLRLADADGVFIALVFASALGVVAAACLPSVEDGSTPETRSGLRDILRHRALARALIAGGLVHGSHAAFYAFGAIYWRSIGFPARTIALLWGLGIVVEIVLFWYAKRLVPWGARRFLIAAAVAAVLRWALFPFATTPVAALFLQLLHGATFGAAHLGVIMAIGAFARPGHTARLQAGYQLIAGVLLATGTILAGPLMAVSLSTALWAMAAVSVAGLIIAWPLRRGLQPQSVASGGRTEEPS